MNQEHYKDFLKKLCHLISSKSCDVTQKVVNHKRMNMVTDGESEGFVTMLHISN